MDKIQLLISQTLHQEVQSTGQTSKEFDVLKLIEGYRVRGHLFTKTNPYEIEELSPTLDMKISDFHLQILNRF
jgi:2-oxoglutarate dehydrogenase complex dehydrogenase (E1) component-like enzyme